MPEPDFVVNIPRLSNGLPYKEDWVIVLVDIYGQVVKDDSSSFLIFSSNSSLEF